MKITSLIENTTPCPHLHAEHGLSLYIQTNEHVILFDMGQTNGLIHNAHQLGCDLTQVEFGVLSHGHYDHGGGIAAFWESNPNAPIYAKPSVFGCYYGKENTYIGLEPSLQSHKQWVFTPSNTPITPTCSLVTLPTHLASPSQGLWMQTKEGVFPDCFEHEHYLLIKEKNQSVLITGCSHKGIVPIAKYFRPDVLIGGFHLLHTQDNNAIHQTALELEKLSTVFYTCHCTGREPYLQLKNTMSRLHYLAGGETIEL